MAAAEKQMISAAGTPPLRTPVDHRKRNVSVEELGLVWAQTKQ